MYRRSCLLNVCGPARLKSWGFVPEGVRHPLDNSAYFGITEAENEDDEDTEALLAADFEIGQFIRERIIPKAVLYFTGEALEEDDDYDEEEGEEEDEEADDYDEEADPDFNPVSYSVEHPTS